VDGLTLYTFPFTLRGVGGTVRVRYGTNDDPARWGYPELELDWYDEDLVKGFPVMEASVEHPAEGYGADMGWVQIVHYEIRDPGEQEVVTVFDVPPQLSDTDIPYLAFGVRPTVFDAPSITSREVTWRADTFLTYTPDAVLSRLVRPLLGFRWGYDVSEGNVRVDDLVELGPDGWRANRPDLHERFSGWVFETAEPWGPDTSR
jgi:hypothetical protein